MKRLQASFLPLLIICIYHVIYPNFPGQEISKHADSGLWNLLTGQLQYCTEDDFGPNKNGVLETLSKEPVTVRRLVHSPVTCLKPCCGCAPLLPSLLPLPIILPVHPPPLILPIAHAPAPIPHAPAHLVPVIPNIHLSLKLPALPALAHPAPHHPAPAYKHYY